MHHSIAHRLRLTRPLLAAAACLLVSASATAQVPDRTPPGAAPRWQQLGPLVGAGPEAFRLASSTLHPDEVYASSAAGLLRSTDRGVTWSVRSTWPRRFGRAPFLGVCPTDPDRVAVSRFFGGVDVTHDGGATWFRPSVPPADTTIFSIAYDPVDPNTIFCGGVAGIWRSRDGGDTFDRVVDLSANPGDYCGSLHFDRNNRDRIYGIASATGVHASEDGGETWILRPYPSGFSHPLSTAIDPRDGRRLLLGGYGLTLSDDGGETWTTPWSSANLVDSVAFDPLDAGRFYAGTRSEGFIIVTDHGATSTLVTDPGLDAMGGNPYTILPSLAHPGEIVVSGAGGFARSTDSGLTFQRTNGGLEAHAFVQSLAANPADPLHLVAKTGGSAFVSLDGGATWTESVTGPAFVGYDVVADAGVPGRFYAGGRGVSSARLWRSDDGGFTFAPIFGDPTIYFWHLEAHPTDANVLFGAGRGVQKSVDGGVSFTNLGVPSNWVWDVAVSPTDPDVLYASTSSTVYATLDGGLTWTAATTPPAPIVRDLEVDPLDPHRAWACTPGQGQWRTDDGGAHWMLLPGSPDDAQVSHVPDISPGWLLTGESRGWRTFASRSGGLGAAPFGFHLGSIVQSFASTPTDIYAATSGGGVFVLR